MTGKTESRRTGVPVDAKLAARVVNMRKGGESRRVIAEKVNLSVYAVDRVLAAALKSADAAKKPSKTAAKAKR